jgi:hypothetical protein
MQTRLSKVSSESDCLVRLKIEVNGQEIYSNYQPGDVELQEDLRGLSKEQRVQLLEDPSLITL